MIEQIILGRIECLPLWYVDNKIISILAIVGHQMILLNRTEVQDVGYSLGFIPDRIRISGEVTNFIFVCNSYVTMDMYILSIRSISDI